MVILGIDAHKRTHTVVAVDEAAASSANDDDGDDHRLIISSWCAGPSSSASERRWAVEDCRHLSRRLERDLLAAGERIVRVPPKLMAACPRRGPDLRQVRPDRRAGGGPGGAARTGPARGPARRAGAGAAAAGRSPRRPGRRTNPARSTGCAGTSTSSTRPGTRPPGRSTRYSTSTRSPPDWPAMDGHGRPHRRGLVERMPAAHRRMNERSSDEITDTGQPLAPTLLAIVGCGAAHRRQDRRPRPPTSRRFRSKDAYARHNGTAPLPVWSAQPRTATASPAPATANSTPPSTASPSPRRAATPTPSAYLDRRTASGQHRHRSPPSPQSAASPTSSTAPSSRRPRTRASIDRLRRSVDQYIGRRRKAASNHSSSNLRFDDETQ